MDQTLSATSPEDINAWRLLALRGALKLETLGFKRHGRSARVIANEEMGTNYRTAKKAYEAFDAWLVAKYPGRIDSRPL